MSPDRFLIHMFEASRGHMQHMDSERTLFFSGALTVSIAMIVASLEIDGFRLAFALLSSAGLMLIGLLLTWRIAGVVEFNLERIRDMADYVDANTTGSGLKMRDWLGPVDDGPPIPILRSRSGDPITLSQRLIYVVLYGAAILGFGISGLVAYLN